MSTNFPGSPHKMGFVAIFLYYGKFMRKPMHFPYGEAYHRMEILWEKITHTIGKSMSTNFPGSTMQWVLMHFPVL